MNAEGRTRHEIRRRYVLGPMLTENVTTSSEATLTPPTWNQIAGWVKELEDLRGILLAATG